MGQISRGADHVAFVQVAAGDLDVKIIGVAGGHGHFLKGHVHALAAGLAQHIAAAVVGCAYGVARHGKDIVFLVDNDLHLGGNADQQPAVVAVDHNFGTERALIVGNGVDLGQRAVDDGIAGGVAGDAAGHAGGKLGHAVGGDGHFHHQCVGVLDGGDRAGADRADRGIQCGDGAVHRGGQGAVVQCAAQRFKVVRCALGLFQLGGAVLNVLGLVQQIGIVFLLVIAVVGRFDLLLTGVDLFGGRFNGIFGAFQRVFGLGLGGACLRICLLDGIIAVQVQGGNRAVVFGTVQSCVGGVIVSQRRVQRGFGVVLGLGVRLSGGAAVVIVNFHGHFVVVLGLGIGLLGGCVGGIQRFDISHCRIVGRFQRVVVRHRAVVGALGLALLFLRFGQVVLGILQRFVGLLDLGLQINQGVLMLHGGSFQISYRAVAARLCRLQRIAVAFLGTLDLLFQVAGVQRGNHIAFFDGVAHGYLDFADLVQLGRICHGDAGLVAGFYGAVHADRICQVGFLQGGGAHKLIGGAGSPFAAQHSAQHQHRRDQHHQQQSSQLLMLAEPRQWIAPGLYGIFHRFFVPLSTGW